MQAVAMRYLEAAVVVYLRAIHYPEGFSFPLKPMDTAWALAVSDQPFIVRLPHADGPLEVPGLERRRRAGHILWMTGASNQPV